MKIDITCRVSGKTLFSHDCEENSLKVTVEAAVSAGASLAGASLTGASLDGASLVGASLDGASLVGASLVGASLAGASLAGASLDGASLVGASLDGASLVGASLVGASLAGASLAGASLDGASLVGASLDGASLVGASLVGARPIFQIGPIGSRSAYLVAFATDKGLRIKAGCFFGTTEDFLQKVTSTHGNNLHAKEYAAAVDLILKHAELFGGIEAREEEK